MQMKQYELQLKLAHAQTQNADLSKRMAKLTAELHAAKCDASGMERCREEAAAEVAEAQHGAHELRHRLTLAQQQLADRCSMIDCRHVPCLLTVPSHAMHLLRTGTNGLLACMSPSCHGCTMLVA